MPLLSTVHPMSSEISVYQVEYVLVLAALLPIVLQPVFAAWLVRHSNRAVLSLNKDTLCGWFAGMHADRALMEYQLILTEIAWLELVIESDQIHALQKEAL